MKTVSSVVLRALVILIVWGLIGMGVNLISPKGIPWIYVQARTIDLAGMKLPLISEREARQFFGESGTVFIDARTREDFARSHVKGAVFLPPGNVQERFITVQSLLPEEARIVLYCYGPECDMAEQVAEFLGQMGYPNMSIMSAGFAAWEKAGYPTGSLVEDE